MWWRCRYPLNLHFYIVRRQVQRHREGDGRRAAGKGVEAKNSMCTTPTAPTPEGRNLEKAATTLNQHTNLFCCPLIWQTSGAAGRVGVVASFSRFGQVTGAPWPTPRIVCAPHLRPQAPRSAIRQRFARPGFFVTLSFYNFFRIVAVGPWPRSSAKFAGGKRDSCVC